MTVHVLSLLVCFVPAGLVSAQDSGSRSLPSRILPVPNYVSPQLQKMLSEAPSPSPEFPKTADEWRRLVALPEDLHEQAELHEQTVLMQDKFKVDVVSQSIGGVHCYIVTPKTWKGPRPHHRLLLDLHPGGLVYGAGEGGIGEAVVLANATGEKVIEVDYRMLPDFPYPAAMNDAIAVWRAIITFERPGNIGVMGSSIGGGMVLSLVQRAKKEGLPLPGAVVSITPWADLSKTGDSYYANDGVDGTITYDGFWAAIAKLYSGALDLKDPRISPVYGDFAGFPPTFLISGTRDLFLSNTVRVHHKLMQVGVPTQLEVEEAQPHTDIVVLPLENAPEGAELYAHIAHFFGSNLGH